MEMKVQNEWNKKGGMGELENERPTISCKRGALEMKAIFPRDDSFVLFPVLENRMSKPGDIIRIE